MARLDSELVRLGLARARGHAAELVATGRVLVDGRVARKVAQSVREGTRLELLPGPGPDYVGRGAHKLAGVLDELERRHPPGVPVDGLRCLDAGSSTGGFTQVLLERGARQVLAVDVGHDQLASALREDARVLDLSGTTVRGLTPDAIGGPVDLLVADLSFISLSLVLPDLRRLARPDGQLVVLVKPQFEVGRERLGSSGVVRDPGLRAEAVAGVCTAGVGQGLAVRAVRASRWPGSSGNVEYFVWFTPSPSSTPPMDEPCADGQGRAARIVPEGTPLAGGTTDAAGIESAVRVAVEEGPA
jgi:23S rRNA (cytidine1920-2'-O)/16S rRNA (cytidine1409-2'-O)-methyltransferase